MFFSGVNKERFKLRIASRHPEYDFCILERVKGYSAHHAHLPVYNGRVKELVGREMVLASFRIGIEEDASSGRSQLGFTKARVVTLSEHNRHIFYSCPTFAGDSGAALLLMEGQLVGIHQESVNPLRERLDRKRLIEGKIEAAENSVDVVIQRGISQGCVGLLAHTFTTALRVEEPAL
jgi:hypothetical protein